MSKDTGVDGGHAGIRVGRGRTGKGKEGTKGTPHSVGRCGSVSTQDQKGRPTKKKKQKWSGDPGREEHRMARTKKEETERAFCVRRRNGRRPETNATSQCVLVLYYINIVASSSGDFPCPERTP